VTKWKNRNIMGEQRQCSEHGSNKKCALPYKKWKSVCHLSISSLLCGNNFEHHLTTKGDPFAPLLMMAMECFQQQ